MASANRIDRTFAELSASGRKGLLPYLTAGYPDLETTARIIESISALGVSAVELGIPYSDPIADGPVIQASYTRALERGLRLAGVLAMVTELRRRIELPLLAMVSFSIVYRIGVEKFVQRAAAAGFDGLIIPDLSLEEGPSVAKVVGSAGLRLSMMVAPNTSERRSEQIAEVSSGFIYYMSVMGITGERDRVAADLSEKVSRLRRFGDQPVVVGFGISRPEHVRVACQSADGAIVGSAIIRRIGEQVDAGANGDTVVSVVRDFVAELMTGVAPEAGS